MLKISQTLNTFNLQKPNLNKLAGIALCMGLLLILNSGCSGNGGELLITKPQKSERVKLNKKIVLIDPSFLMMDSRKKESEIFLASDDRESKMTTSIVDLAARNDIELQVIDIDQIGADEVSYFNDILPLKKNIYLSFGNSDLEGKRVKGRAKADEQTIAQLPKISSEFSYLSEKYGTPNFQVNGVVSYIKRDLRGIMVLFFVPPWGALELMRPNARTYYYSITVDVERAEIIYSEVRLLRTTPSERNLKPMIYDSYAMLREEIND